MSYGQLPYFSVVGPKQLCGTRAIGKSFDSIHESIETIAHLGSPGVSCASAFARSKGLESSGRAAIAKTASPKSRALSGKGQTLLKDIVRDNTRPARRSSMTGCRDEMSLDEIERVVI